MLRHFYSVAVCTFLMFTSGHAMALATAEFASLDSSDRVHQLVSQRLEAEASLRNNARLRDADRESKMLALQVVKRRARADAVLLVPASPMNLERFGLLAFVTCLPLSFGGLLYALTRRTIKVRDLERSRIFKNRPEIPEIPERLTEPLPPPVNQYVQFLEEVKQQRALLTIEECADITPVHGEDKLPFVNEIGLPLRGRQDFHASFKLLVAVSKLNLALLIDRNESKSISVSRSLNFNQLLEEVPELRTQNKSSQRRKAV